MRSEPVAAPSLRARRREHRRLIRLWRDMIYERCCLYIVQRIRSSDFAPSTGAARDSKAKSLLNSWRSACAAVGLRYRHGARGRNGTTYMCVAAATGGEELDDRPTDRVLSGGGLGG